MVTETRWNFTGHVPQRHCRGNLSICHSVLLCIVLTCREHCSVPRSRKWGQGWSGTGAQCHAVEGGRGDRILLEHQTNDQNTNVYSFETCSNKSNSMSVCQLVCIIIVSSKIITSVKYLPLSICLVSWNKTRHIQYKQHFVLIKLSVSLNTLNRLPNEQSSLCSACIKP